MRRSPPLLFSLALCALLPSALIAQRAGSEPSPVKPPSSVFRLPSAILRLLPSGLRLPAPDSHHVSLKLTVDEGTWMSLDVSPDGKTIVFDLLGDLYTLPIAGGKATRITSGPAWDAAPRFSPDGKRILFSTDRSGSDQLWLVNPDGGSPLQITHDGGHQFAVSAWAPDGQYVIAMRGAIESETLANDLALLNINGGSGSSIINESALGPTVSADGRWLYYSLGGYRQSGTVNRLDLRTGEKLTIVTGYDDAFRPALTRDGRTLAFGAKIDGKNVLMIRDLETNRDRVLYRGLDMLAGSGSDDLDLLPGYAFTPDDRSIVFAADGKIRRVDIATGSASVIPFSADIDQTLTEKLYVRGRIKDGPFSPKVLHWAQPVGSGRIMFVAAGKLYLYDTTSHKAAPFADGPGLQYAPALSPDGQWIAYVSWIDTIGGEILKAPISGGAPVRLTNRPGRYQNLSWSADGKRLVTAEENTTADGLQAVDYKLHWLDADHSGDLHWIATIKSRGMRKEVPRPVFSASGERIFYSESNAGAWELGSMGLHGEDRHLLAKSRLADEMIPSADGKWLAFTEHQDVYLAALPPAGHEGLDVYGRGGAFPVYRLSTEGGDYIHWQDGGKTIAWSWGPKVSTVDLATATNGAKVTPRTTIVSFDIPRAQGAGAVLLRNARLITMKGDEVIEHGEILVENSRITAIGRAGQVKAPTGATSMDLTGKTIVPGFVDLHAHYGVWGATGVDVYPEQNTELLANLAYGITTWRDPSARSQTLFALGELVESGRNLGPRIFSTGDIFFAVDYVCCGQAQSLDDARAMERRQKALGATYIKEHTDPKREQVQWIVQAAREEGLMLASDPARGPRRELRTIMEGMTSLEHVYAPSPIKKDVMAVFKELGAFYVPTVFVYEEDYYFTSMNLHDDPKLRRFIPHEHLDHELQAHNGWQMPQDWKSPRHAEDIRNMVRGGVKVGMGSHGQVQGLGPHLEMWMMASAGLTPLEALRMSTLTGAEALGFQDDIGSLETGKLADFIVLNKNPLTDLKNSTAIAYVMKGGVMWNGDTMDEVWPTKHKRPRASWEDRP